MPSRKWFALKRPRTTEGMNLFKLIVDIGLNASGYQLGIKQVESATAALGQKIDESIKDKIAEAFGVAALEEFARRTIENSDHILDLSQRLDVSTKSIQEWGYAAKKAGSDVDAAAQFLEHLSAMREKALGGGDDAPGAQALFAKFGIGLKDLGQSADDLGRKIAKAFESGSTQELVGALKELGGKGASSLIPAFKDGFDALAQAAMNAGKILDTEVLVRLKAIGDELKRLFSPGSGGAMVLTWFAEKLQDAFSVVKIGMGGMAAFVGALTGGAGMKEALKAAMDVFDEETKAREDRERDIQRKTDEANQAGKDAGNNFGAIDPEAGVVLGHDPKVGRAQGQHEGSGEGRIWNEKKTQADRQKITPWQQIGAAVRFSGHEELHNIEQYTKQTSQNTKDLLLANKNPGSNLDFLSGGGGF